MLDAVVLAIALAMDATAVAAARGLTARPRLGEALTIGVVFGAFQAGMAAIGWLGGATALPWIEAWDHWVAFGLLALLGGKMVIGALREGDPAPIPKMTARLLLGLAIATSIDALAAGVTLPVLEVGEPAALALIGAVTAALSTAGALVGGALGARAGSRLELAGGLALVAIGVKILIEHLS